MIGFGFGFSNFFALPLALSFDDEDGVTSITLHIGPFFIEIQWGAS